MSTNVDVRPSEGATLLADLARGRFELTYLQSPDVVEPHVLSWFFSSDRIPEAGKREGANRWRLRNRELDEALELTKALDHMPLAINQAAAYISQEWPLCSVQQYLEKLSESEKSKLSLLDLNEGDLRRDK